MKWGPGNDEVVWLEMDFSGRAGVEGSSRPGFVGDSEDIGRSGKCPVNLYDSDQLRDHVEG